MIEQAITKGRLRDWGTATTTTIAPHDVAESTSSVVALEFPSLEDAQAFVSEVQAIQGRE
jgi:hypothetical protein